MCGGRYRARDIYTTDAAEESSEIFHRERIGGSETFLLIARIRRLLFLLLTNPRYDTKGLISYRRPSVATGAFSSSGVIPGLGGLVWVLAV